MNGKNDGILQKLGFHENGGINEANDDPIRFLKPTSQGGYAVHRKGNFIKNYVKLLKLLLSYWKLL